MNNSDRDIGSFEERLKDHAIKQWSNIERLRIDLTDARNIYLYDIAGEYIAVEKTSSAPAAATIRLDRTNRDEIHLVRGRIIETLFAKFHISNAAQAGEWIDIVIGRNFRTWLDGSANRNAESQQVLNVTNIAANANTVCAAGDVQAAHIKADVNNAGIVWVDFGAAAVQNGCIPLDPGEWVIMPLSNTNRINANFEIANEILYITPIV